MSDSISDVQRLASLRRVLGLSKAGYMAGANVAAQAAAHVDALMQTFGESALDMARQSVQSMRQGMLPGVERLRVAMTEVNAALQSLAQQDSARSVARVRQAA